MVQDYDNTLLVSSTMRGGSVTGTDISSTEVQHAVGDKDSRGAN